MGDKTKSEQSESQAGTTTDHTVIQQWVEARGGHPATVKGTEHGDDAGVLRIDFPGYSGAGTLEEISWDEFIEKFEEAKLAFLYQEETKGGQESRFCKFVSRKHANRRAGVSMDMTPNQRDEAVFVREQYRDSTNLAARIDLYAKYSTNRQGWHRWLFEQLPLPAHSRVLELGCGPATLWLANQDRISAGWELTLTDLSPGMIEQAKENLAGIDGAPHFALVDAQSIPYPDRSFDAVLANHVLYHVPDRPAAYAEIRRVLRPGGMFVASTLGDGHLRELRDLVHQLDPESRFGRSLGFTLDTGNAELRRWFQGVETRRYDDALLVPEVEPLLTYLASGMAKAVTEGDRRQRVIRWAEEQIAISGAVRLSTDSGVFIARRAWQ